MGPLRQYNAEEKPVSAEGAQLFLLSCFGASVALPVLADVENVEGEQVPPRKCLFLHLPPTSEKQLASSEFRSKPIWV